MSSFDYKWEELYERSKGKHLNKYPYGQLVTYFFRNLKYLPSNKPIRVLEIGCGVGNNLPLILNEGFNAYGIDGSSSAIEIAKKTLQKYNRCELKVMDFSKIEYEENFFDMIIDRQAIYANKTDKISRIFLELNRVLKRDGVFLSFMYNINDYHFHKIKKDPTFAEKIDEFTFTNFKGGTFKGTGVAHFFTKYEIEKLCKMCKFKILTLAENKIDEHMPKKENKVSEYILVAQKC